MPPPTGQLSDLADRLQTFAKNLDEGMKGSRAFIPEQVKLPSGEIAFKSADMFNGEPVLVRSPDFLDEAGHIKWPEADGFVTDSAGIPITEPANLKAGQLIDRYGSNAGRFTSPIENGQILAYDTRGLPYPESYQSYHQYEVVKDINLENIKEGFKNLSDSDKLELDNLMRKYDLTLEDIANIRRGEIAEVFGQGGGIQIKLGTSVYWYEKLGLLREVV